MQLVPLDSLLDYGRCPLLYWWRRRARIEAPPTVEALPERAVRQGLIRYYEGRALSVLKGSVTAWREWLAEWGCLPETMVQLQEYVDVDTCLLMPFLDGSIQRDDGTSYRAPRMTRHYKEQARATGLTELGRELKRAMENVPLVVAGKYDPITAFSDTVLMALRYEGPERDPYGNTRPNYPFEVPITEGILIKGLADLVIMEKEVTVAEIHDYGPYRPPVPALSRHLEVVALAHAEGEGWGDSFSIVYRHLPTGFSVRVYEGESGDRLLSVVAAALRGVQCGVYLPRIAVAERDCLHCAYYGLCVTEDGLDILDDLDATLVALDQSGWERRRGRRRVKRRDE